MRENETDQDADLNVATTLATWLEDRDSERQAWKKVSSLMALFRAQRWTSHLQARIGIALEKVDIETDPSLSTLTAKDTVRFRFRTGLKTPEDDSSSGDFSDQMPSLIAAWHDHNIVEDPEEKNPYGQFLWCLKDTEPGARMFVWEATSGRGIVGVVTFGHAWFREGRQYARWGKLRLFPRPIPREQLLEDHRTRERFGANGIRALQGSPIHLKESEADAIVELLGGLEPTRLPVGRPRKGDRPEDWKRNWGLLPEQPAEKAIHLLPRLQADLGLTEPTKEQFRLPSKCRIDLVSGNTVIEVKRSVDWINGPDQIQGYMEEYGRITRTPPGRLRGILVQQNRYLVPRLCDSLATFPYPLEIWAVYMDPCQDGKWQAECLLRHAGFRRPRS